MSAHGSAPELRAVTGPDALGGGSRRAFELLWLMSVTDFRKTYLGTFLGYLWSLLRPLLTFAVLLVVFTKIIRIGSTIPDYAMFLLFNIVLISFFQEATANATTSVAAKEGIVRKTQFPRLVIPMAVVTTGLFNLAMNLIAVFGFMLAFGVYPMWSWLLFPVLLLALVIMTSSVAILLSALYVRHRDVAIIWGVMSMAIFYGSGVLIPVDFAGNTLRDLLLLNPLTTLFVEARVWMIDPNAPSVFDLVTNEWILIVPATIFISLPFVAWRYFRSESPKVAEAL